MRRKQAIVPAALGLLACLGAPAALAEPATVSRATDLLEKAFADAKPVAALAPETKVDVLRGDGAWREVKTTQGQTGWVRMLALRYGEGGAPQKSSSNPLGAIGGLLNAGRTSNTATVTTGVRGLDTEDLENAQPNANELGKLQRFAVDSKVAQGFATRTKLTTNKVEYLGEKAGGKDAAAGGK